MSWILRLTLRSSFKNAKIGRPHYLSNIQCRYVQHARKSPRDLYLNKEHISFNSRLCARQFSSLASRTWKYSPQGLLRKYLPPSQSIRENFSCVNGTPSTQTAHSSTNPVVGYWLLSCSALVLAIIVVGGVTRLTESGLSITEWKPITGVIFPTSEQHWMEEYDKYRMSPEFKMLNSLMTLEEFKKIYYMEWLHRVLGRALGVAFVLPALYFIARRHIIGRDKLLVGVATTLIGFQGFLGWYMVKSGLDDSLIEEIGAVPRVSQYRLAAHLGTALILYVGTLWKGLSILADSKTLRTGVRIQGVFPASFRRSVIGVTSLVFLTALSGAFVAGLDAGLVYNEFPYMGEHIVPPPAEMFKQHPLWKNLFENPTTVQFDHRVLATAVYIAVTGMFLASYKSSIRTFLAGRTLRLVQLSFLLANIQVLLGISTLLYLVPVNIAASHQAGSVLLLSSLLATANSMRRSPSWLKHAIPSGTQIGGRMTRPSQRPILETLRN